MTRDVILEVRNLNKHFKLGGNEILKAVDDISLEFYEGEILGIVGESGCGKSTLGKIAIGILEKTSGQVLYRGKYLHNLNRKELKEFSKKVQMLFQDPYSSLNPKMRVYEIVSEGLIIHNMISSRDEQKEKVMELLAKVGLGSEHATRYIHEFSGGQIQRISIARSLAVNPDFLLCDEPISALDVSVQAQIVNLLLKLRDEEKLTIGFIAHDLSMVRYISDRVAVMYLGEIVELADTDNLFDNTLHPYTEALISAIPIPDPKNQKNRTRIKLEGEITEFDKDFVGCKFYKRCHKRKDICKIAPPVLKEYSENHSVACYLWD